MKYCDGEKFDSGIFNGLLFFRTPEYGNIAMLHEDIL
jgi:hypothetical protein